MTADGLQDKDVEALYGVTYFAPGTQTIKRSVSADAYTYTTYLGKHDLSVEEGDSAWIYESKGRIARIVNGPATIQTTDWATIIRGYRTEDRTATVSASTNLPYVNGCSTRQIFPPDRGGDPTLQLLKIPAHSSEQAHHIHSTVRIVYVFEGEGYSKVGMKDVFVKRKLVPGMLVVLEKMSPHHFETEGSPLVVIPLHVFSALPGGTENNHPMFNGTFLMNQGS